MEPLTPRKMPQVEGSSQPTLHFTYGDREALQAEGTETLPCKSEPVSRLREALLLMGTIFPNLYIYHIFQSVPPQSVPY